MRERWFADDRDLVKWAVLVSLAQKHGVQSITQVTYRRRSEALPVIDIDGVGAPVPREVWEFFRDLGRIRDLGSTARVLIDIVGEHFDPSKRGAYMDAALRHVVSAARPRLVFLDPDTGLQPERASPEHTTRDEVRRCWSALSQGEWLVLYQHARRTKTWVDDVLQELRALCPGAPVTIARSRDVGRDVVFYALRKS